MRAPMPHMGRRGKMLLVVAVTLILLLIALGSLVDVLTDRLWFREVHYSRVFSTMIWTRVLMFLIVGAVTGGVVAGSLYLAYRLRPLLRPTSTEQQALERYRMLLQPRMGWWIGIFS